MIQPKYSPEEALKRAKLLMKYDTRKTLTENKQLEEQSWGAALSGGAVGAGLASIFTKIGAMGLLGKGAVATAAANIGWLWPAVLVGGAAGLTYWLVTKDTGKPRVEQFFQLCVSDKANISKIERMIGDSELKSIASEIEASVYHQEWGFLPAGTDEERLFAAFKKLEVGNSSDFCRLIELYNQTSKSGDLWDDLDSDIDSSSEWDQIYEPIKISVENSLKTIVLDLEKICKENPNDERCPKEDLDKICKENPNDERCPKVPIEPTPEPVEPEVPVSPEDETDISSEVITYDPNEI